MAIRDFTSQRLYVEGSLATGIEFACTPDQANYLRTVLRMPDGGALLVFNGRDGEWQAALQHKGKRDALLSIAAQTRAQESGPDLWYCFAPLKRSRLDYMVQKSVEMGASRLVPVLTQHTVADRVNTERMRANIVEAAEQCGILSIATASEPVKLASLLADWPAGRLLIFCDEAAAQKNPLDVLRTLPRGPAAVLVGPEGGFSDSERATIIANPCAHAISLGPRIMRADTAAVAALALVNAVFETGD